MAPAAERQQVHDTMFVHARDGSAALAKPLSQPAPIPTPGRDDEKRRKQRKAVHIAVVQRAAGLAAVMGAFGAVFLGGHVQLAREAQRSVIVNDMLKQQVERSRLLGNKQARDVTPTSINQKAIQTGMVHPDERDAIVLR